jgi:hypothetical protein
MQPVTLKILSSAEAKANDEKDLCYLDNYLQG